MNDCPKCSGLITVERDLLDGDTMKCLNCGYRGAHTMPRFKTEAGKQRWLASMAARRGTKKTASVAADGSVVMKSSHAGGIAGALDEIDAKIAALEQVKRLPLKAQELVTR